MCILSIVNVSNDSKYGSFQVIAFQRDENTRAKCNPLNFYPNNNEIVGLFNSTHFNSPFAMTKNGYAVLLGLRLHRNDSRCGARDFKRGQYINEYLTTDVSSVEFAKQKKNVEGTFPHIMFLCKKDQSPVYYSSDEKEILEVKFDDNEKISCFTAWTGDRTIRYYRKERI